jgi:hypothetical protein
MEKEIFKPICLKICIDEDGYITSATNEDGTEIKYHPDEPKKVHGHKTRLSTPNTCCWRNTPLGMKCSPAYC